MYKQCKACPWRVDVVPDRDIPDGYCEDKHRALEETIAKDPGLAAVMNGGSLRMMACHESPVGREKACAGWVANQLGPGNNIGLRLRASRTGEFNDLELIGEQHERFEETLGKEIDQ